MSIITKLTAILTADSAQFESGIKKASNSMKGFTSAIKSGVAVAATSLLALGAAMLALGTKSAAAIEKNYELAKSLGVASKEFKALSIVAEESGVSQEEMTSAFTKSQKALYDAANGSKSAQENFAKLGLSVSDLMKMSPKDQFIAIGDALSKVQNPTERTALAMELMGKGGRNVINMLSDLGLKYAEAMQFADKFNISVSDVDSEQIDAAGDAVGRIGMAVEGAGNTIAVKFSPIVEEAANQLIDAAISGEDLGDAIDSGMRVAGEGIDIVRKAILGLKVVFRGVETSILMMAAKIQEAFNFVRDQMRSIGIDVAPNSTDWIDWANEAKKQTRGVVDEINKFESTASKIDKIKVGAKERATTNAGRNGTTGSEGGGIEGATKKLDKASEKTLKLEADTKSLADMYKEFEKSSGSAIDNLVSDLGRGGDALQSFRNFAVSILQDVLKSLNGGNTIGSSLGGLIAGGLTNILSGGSLISQGIQAGGSTAGMYAGLASITGSFATGISKVPYDMNARIHRGEAIIPASQVDNMGGNGSQTINIDARGAQNGVEEKIRQVMNEVAILRKDTPKIAMNVVSDQNRRNSNFLR